MELLPEMIIHDGYYASYELSICLGGKCPEDLKTGGFMEKLAGARFLIDRQDSE